MEDRRKVVACLELCGKSDNDVTKMLDAADKRGDLGMDAFVPQRIQDFIDKAKVGLIFSFVCFLTVCTQLVRMKFTFWSLY